LFVHIIVLLVVVVLPISGVLPFIPIEPLGSEILWTIIVTTSLTLLALFYLNYLILIPKYYFKGQKIQYAVLLLLIVVTLVVLTRSFIFFTFSRYPGYINELPSAEFLPFVILRVVLTVVLSSSIALFEKWQEEKNERQKAELHLLKLQFNPHFLFNALNAVYSKTLGVADDASDMIIKLSALMRYNLNQTNKRFISFNEELECVLNYIEIQKIRSPVTAKIDLQIECENTTLEIAPFLLVPLIENAFKYGIGNDDNCQIVIFLKLCENEMIFSVINKKVSIDLLELEAEGYNYGISSIVKRLEILYPFKHEFKISESDHDFKVSLKIELK